MHLIVFMTSLYMYYALCFLHVEHSVCHETIFVLININIYLFYILIVSFSIIFPFFNFIYFIFNVINSHLIWKKSFHLFYSLICNCFLLFFKCFIKRRGGYVNLACFIILLWSDGTIS